MQNASTFLITVLLCLAAAPNTTAQSVTRGTDITASLESGGLTRTFQLHLPPSDKLCRPMPLVIMLHGGRVDGSSNVPLTWGCFNILADSDGAIIAYPDAYEKNWNDGRALSQYASNAQNVDDVLFISQMIDHIASRWPIDQRRVYATGISNGGLMCLRLARDLSHRIVAVAPVAASMASNISTGAFPTRPVSVYLVAGTADPLIPYLGGTVGYALMNLGSVIGAPQTVALWAKRNGCSDRFTMTSIPNRDPNDGTQAVEAHFGISPDGTEVTLCTVFGGGHTWPGGLPLPEILNGRTCKDFNACVAIWSFFKRH